MNPLFHIVSRTDWDAARAAGSHRPDSLASEGFIHLSGIDQVESTADRYYRDAEDHVVLVVDPEPIDEHLRWEDLAGHGAFPHLYAPLPVAAVHHVVPLETAADGSRTAEIHATGGDVAPLAPAYPKARADFVRAAEHADATTAAHPHPRRGLDGEELTVDVATLGDPDGAKVVLVVSATHGVEGYAGSALQRHWLLEHASTRPGDVTVVMVHGFNPYGFSWVRRVNEDNVDLNRNFVDWDGEGPPASGGYADLARLLVPAVWSEAEQARTLEALLAAASEIGFDRMQSIITSGQHVDPTGVFYGGNGPVWSHRWLREWAAGALAGVGDLAVLDLHTGLGPWGDCQLIGHAAPETEDHRRAAAWWGSVVPMGAAGSVSAELSGDWLGITGQLVAPGARATGVALEFGTVDPLTVLNALRADAWLHAHGDPNGPDGAAIRQQVRAAFADDDPRWIRSCWPHFARAMAAGFANLGA